MALAQEMKFLCNPDISLTQVGQPNVKSMLLRNTELSLGIVQMSVQIMLNIRHLKELRDKKPTQQKFWLLSASQWYLMQFTAPWLSLPLIAVFGLQFTLPASPTYTNRCTRVPQTKINFSKPQLFIVLGIYTLPLT